MTLWHLVWIIPLSATVGYAAAVLMAAAAQRERAAERRDGD